MTRSLYRPWGQLPWVLRHSPATNWSLFGALGTEERSISTWRVLNNLASLDNVKMLRIADKPSQYSSEISAKLSQRHADFRREGGIDAAITDIDLFAAHSEIVDQIDDFISSSNGSVVIDITSLPKRFFFPVLRRVLTASVGSHVDNLLVTYAMPRGYPTTNLAENFNDWAHLPLFSGGYSALPPEMLVIGVGFQALGLHEHLKGESGMPIRLLIPFPAPLPAALRSWELRRQLESYGSPDMFEVFRASAHDASDTFDRLCSLTRRGTVRCSLAPFGPKPMSLGMCIFAILADCEVFYTQPAVYHPDYSIGIAVNDGLPLVYGYCIKIDRNTFYSL